MYFHWAHLTYVVLNWYLLSINIWGINHIKNHNPHRKELMAVQMTTDLFEVMRKKKDSGKDFSKLLQQYFFQSCSHLPSKFWSLWSLLFLWSHALKQLPFLGGGNETTYNHSPFSARRMLTRTFKHCLESSTGKREKKKTNNELSNTFLDLYLTLVAVLCPSLPNIF